MQHRSHHLFCQKKKRGAEAPKCSGLTKAEFTMCKLMHNEHVRVILKEKQI